MCWGGEGGGLHTFVFRNGRGQTTQGPKMLKKLWCETLEEQD